jgi:hypothetical protein
MRQLLDSGAWHQQQLEQLPAFLTTPYTVVYSTARINPASTKKFFSSNFDPIFLFIAHLDP